MYSYLMAPLLMSPHNFNHYIIISLIIALQLIVTNNTDEHLYITLRPSLMMASTESCQQ